MDDPRVAVDPDATRQVRHPLPGAPPAPGATPTTSPPKPAPRRRGALAIAAGMVLAAVVGGAGTAAVLVNGPSPSTAGGATAGSEPGQVAAAKTDLSPDGGATIAPDAAEDAPTMAATGSADPVSLDEAPAADPPTVTPDGAPPTPPDRPRPAPDRPPRPRT